MIIQDTFSFILKIFHHFFFPWFNDREVLAMIDESDVLSLHLSIGQKKLFLRAVETLSMYFSDSV